MEYLTAHHQEPPSKPFGQKALDYHRSYLLDYFRSGGFPGIQFMIQNEKLETLQSYVETVIFRDVIERHQISNTSLMKYFIIFLLKTIATPFSINKFYNDIKSQGHKAGKDTLYTISKMPFSFFPFLSSPNLFVICKLHPRKYMPLTMA